MKAQILDIEGKSKGEIKLPKCFSTNIREDIVQKVIEAKKIKHPYGPSPVAGNQYSASGKIIHKRKVWKSQYGRGMSRVPRKIMTRKGSQFRWEGATVPNTRGGRRAHPPKPESMVNTKKINKKEMKIALESAISATAEKKFIEKRYDRLKNLEKNPPFIVESKIVSLKLKEFILGLEKIFGEDLSGIALKQKEIRAGKGKMRGRKHKKSGGMLLVLGENEKFKTKSFDVVNAKSLNVDDLTKGKLGRLTVYTENAIKNLEERK